MALSRAARIFNQTPTVANFKKLAHAQPAEAAAWIESFAPKDPLPQRLVQGLQNTRWSSDLSDAEKLKKMEKLLDTHEASIARAIKTAIKTDEASPVDLGWSSVMVEPQIVQGRLGTVDGVLTLKTSKGAFAIADHSGGALATEDIGTFLGNTVSIRGFVEEKSSGRGKILTALEWTPGKHRDFVSGRVATDGDKVGIRVDSDKFVEVTSRDFKALLKDWTKVGISFAGEVKQVGKRWVFQGHQPKEVHILVSLGDPPTGGNDLYTQAITPSPTSVSTPTTITGPRVATKGYVRRFIAGHIVADPDRYGTRTFKMSKAWGTAEGTTDNSNVNQTSDLQFSPVLDNAGRL